LFINDQFIDVYYKDVKDRAKREELLKKLHNLLEQHRTSTIVVLPDIEKLTVSLCYNLEHFVELIKSKPEYTEKLNDKSTIQDFFSMQT